MRGNQNSRVDLPNLMRGMLHDSRSGVVLLEYIQNAADCSATYISFILTDDALIIEHDGTPFNASNIDAFLTIAGTTKYFGEGQIGGFGRGARSALFFCRKLVLESGVYKLIIAPEKYPDPAFLSGEETHRDLTTFTLNFRNSIPQTVQDNFGVYTDEDFWASTLNRSQYDLRLCLAVLSVNSRSLNRITVTTSKQSITMAASSYVSSTIQLSVHRDAIGDELHTYTFRRRMTAVGAISLGVFDIENVEDSESGLFCCGLPISVPTRTSFCIDAPFKPNQARDTIPVDVGNPYGEHNRLLIREAASIAADWIAEDRSNWILTPRFRVVVPHFSARGRDRDIVAEFIARLRDALRNLPIIPAVTTGNSKIEWFSVPEFGETVAYELPGSVTSWPIPKVTLSPKDSSEAIARLLRAHPTTLVQALDMLASKLAESGEDIFDGPQTLRAWQVEVAAAIKRITSRHERTMIVQKGLDGMNVLMLSATQRTSARDLMAAEPNLSSDTRSVLDKENAPDFINLFQFEELADILLRQASDKRTKSAAFNAFCDPEIIVQLGQKAAIKIAEAEIWETAADPETVGRLRDLCMPTDIPIVLQSLPEIATSCLSNEYVAAALAVGNLARIQLRTCPRLSVLCKIIRSWRKKRTPTAVRYLVAVGDLLVKHYDSLISEVGGKSKRFMATLQTSWIPCENSNQEVDWQRFCSLVFPSETASELFGSLAPFPPFGDPSEWSKSGGLLLKRDFHLLDIDHLDDLFALINSADLHRCSINPDLVIKIREYLYTTRKHWIDKKDDDALRLLMVPCTKGVAPLGQAVSPEEDSKEWRHRESYSANHTISLECWSLMSNREKGLCLVPQYLDIPKIKGPDGYRVLIRKPEAQAADVLIQTRDHSPDTVPTPPSVAGALSNDLELESDAKKQENEKISSAHPHEMDKNVLAKTHNAVAAKGSSRSRHLDQIEILITVGAIVIVHYLVTVGRLDKVIGEISIACIIAYSIYVGFTRSLDLCKFMIRGGTNVIGEARLIIMRIPLTLLIIIFIYATVQRKVPQKWELPIVYASIGIALLSIVHLGGHLWTIRQLGVRGLYQELVSGMSWSGETLLFAVVLILVEKTAENYLKGSIPVTIIAFAIKENLEVFVSVALIVMLLLGYRKAMAQREALRLKVEVGLMSVLTFILGANVLVVMLSPPESAEGPVPIASSAGTKPGHEGPEIAIAPPLKPEKRPGPTTTAPRAGTEAMHEPPQGTVVAPSEFKAAHILELITTQALAYTSTALVIVLIFWLY